jgi:WD40 repeat protein
MNGQHIPGFYYDQEKKKYFRIQTQSAAGGLNLKYSTSNLVKERRKENVQRAATAKKARTQKERVVRRHAHSFVQNDLDREIGFRRRSFYLQNIWPEACMSGIGPSPELVTSSDDQGVVRFFDRDPVSRIIYAVCGENSIKRRHYLGNDQAANLSNPQSQKKLRALDTKSRYGYYPWDEIGRTTSTVSSFQYMPNSGALAVTTIGSDRPPIVQLSDPERDGPHISQQFTPKGCAAIFCSTARPESFTTSHHPNSVAASQTEHLAVGAQQSLLMFTRSPSGSWDSSTLIPDLHADILALTWLSPSTLAAGCRNGKIHLYDSRSGNSSHILTHPYPISRLSRSDDPTRLLCTGLQDTLFLYDARMPRLSPHRYRDGSVNTQNHHYNNAYFETLLPGRHHGNTKRRKLMSKKAIAKWSQPVLSFAHANLDDVDLGVSVNTRMGLVAAGQDLANSNKAIRVSNVWTGKTVREFDPPAQAGRATQKIRDLKLMDDEDGGVELWATWGGDVAKFSW